MIFVETNLIATDNTQTRFVKCIHLLGGSNKKSATVGDFIIIAIKHRRFKRRLIFKKIYLALIVSMKKEKHRLNGSFISAKNNRVILMTEMGKVIGTRIFGPLYFEIKEFSRISKLIAKSKGYV
jgi:large subunit ribosomal protein L14